MAGLGEQPSCLVQPPGPLLSRSSKQDMPGTYTRTRESLWSRFAHSHWLLQPHPSGRGPGKQAGGPFGQEILRLQVLSVVWKGTLWFLSRHDLGPEGPFCLGLRASVIVSPNQYPCIPLCHFPVLRDVTALSIQLVWRTHVLDLTLVRREFPVSNLFSLF